jgi:hypothetical protein
LANPARFDAFLHQISPQNSVETYLGLHIQVDSTTDNDNQPCSGKIVFEKIQQIPVTK